MSTGSMHDHDDLSVAYLTFCGLIADGAGPDEIDRARHALVASAERCGFQNREPLLVWAKRRVETWQRLCGASGRELDATVRILDRHTLGSIFA